MKSKKHRKAHQRTKTEIRDYDRVDTTGFINSKRPLKFEDLGLVLPELPPTQVVSIRLPSELLNQLKAIGSQQDIPYQALIKLMLFESLAKYRKKSA